MSTPPPAPANIRVDQFDIRRRQDNPCCHHGGIRSILPSPQTVSFFSINENVWNNHLMMMMTPFFPSRSSTTLCESSSTPPSLLEERERYRKRREIFEQANNDRLSPTMTSSVKQISHAITSASSGGVETDTEPEQVETHLSCPACMYTGVATCVGLSGYFAHAAYEMQKVAENQKEAFANGNVFVRHNRPFLMALSVGCLGLGAYRWHIG